MKSLLIFKSVYCLKGEKDERETEVIKLKQQ